MSKIEKLQIQGVRSFGNEAAAINIFSPLTLIVGYNGSGKTTIIECLKYATTGELPPNSKGGAFIHDPNLTGEKDQWAQVKMQFKATTGARMVITRNLQLTVKKATRPTRVMECNLVMSKDGEKTSISSRVAELNAIVPQYLGVSKAILENVIFCHQDDSLWPMSEPKSLKTRFDEIFEAQKYTKAIENIKQLRKKQREEHNNAKIIEQHAKEDKDKARRAERRSRQLSDEIEQLRNETKDLKRKANEAHRHAQEAFSKHAQFQGVVDSLGNKRTQVKDISRSIESRYGNLELRHESDEKLHAELEGHEERLQDLQLHEEQARAQSEELDSRIKSIRSERDSKQTEAGRLEGRQISQEQRLQRRSELAQKCAKRYRIRGFEREPDRIQIGEIVDKLNRLGKNEASRAEEYQKENENDLERIRDSIHEILQKRSNIEHAKQSLNDEVISNDQKLREFQSQADSLAVDEAERSAVESDVDETRQKLEEARQKLSEARLDEKLNQISTDIRSMEERHRRLHDEIMESTVQDDASVQRDLLQKDVKDKQRILDAMVKSSGNAIESVLGHAMDISSVDNDCALAVGQKRAALDGSEKDRANAESKLEQLDYQMEALSTRNKKKQEELSTASQRISHAIGDAEPADYLEILDDCQSNRDIRANDVKSFEVLRRWYNECITIARGTKPACRLCKRAFEDDRTIDRFVSNLEKQISTATLTLLQSELAEMESNLQKARDVRGTYEHWLRLKEELPHLRLEIETLQKQRDTSVAKLEANDRSVNAYRETLQEAEAVTRTAAAINRLHTEIEGAQGKIEELTKSSSYSTARRTRTDVKEESDLVTQQLHVLRASESKLQMEERRRREQAAKLEVDLSHVEQKFSTISTKLEKKAWFVQQVEGLISFRTKSHATLQSYSESLEQLQPQLYHEKSRLKEAEKSGRQREREAREQANSIVNDLEGLLQMNRDIQAHDDEGVDSRLVSCQRGIDDLNSSIQASEAEKKKIDIDIAKLQRGLSDQDKVKRILSDNLQYRKELQNLSSIEGEIERLEAQNAEADSAYHQKDYERWQWAHDKASAECTAKLGTMKAKDEQLIQLLHEWELEHKDAATKYKRAHIEVETSKAAIEDLGRYGSALDQAIMRYHSLKMEEINRIVEELWKRTYQGTDVDTILIRSDFEATKGNRSYNYRVCMVKQDAEMDMRGRCSAGQRVLASIIIRLALAECFGVNCGLIALDEPTTNLDKDNIRSLAESLHDIIKARRSQNNFQLIVITHDEEFLRYMRCSDFCENYFRVQRNDRQKSEIWRNSIADVM